MGKVFGHNDAFVTNYLKDNPELPYLVSFPRTGSHWVRYVMELYFKKPSLVVLFKYTEATRFTCYHIHDIPKSKLHSVLYLYRDAVDTVFSNMKYNKQNLNDIEIITRVANSYCDHIDKWVISKDLTKKSLFVKYENFKENFSEEFKKVCDFFGEDFNEEKLQRALSQTNKDKIANATGNMYSKIDSSKEYQGSRESFTEKHSLLINNIVKKRNLENYV